MTPADDMTVDYPHGTTTGYKRGCHGSGECPGGYGQTCVRASIRAASEWQYSRAVAKDREVEFLEREAAPAEPPVKTAKAQRAEAQQRKNVREAPATPTGFQPDPSDRLDGWDRTDPTARGVHEDGRPFHAPEPPRPIEPVLGNPTTYPEARCPRTEAHTPHEWTRGLGAYVSEDRDTWCPGRLLPAGFEVFDRNAQRGRSQEARRASAQASTAAQRERALATATPEHPLGLKLDGTPRTRPAKGTRLVDGTLVEVVTMAHPDRDGSTPSTPPVAPPAAEPTVPGATTADLEEAAAAAERVAAMLANTDWKAVARSLGRIADAMEKLRGLA